MPGWAALPESQSGETPGVGVGGVSEQSAQGVPRGSAGVGAGVAVLPRELPGMKGLRAESQHPRLEGPSHPPLLLLYFLGGRSPASSAPWSVRTVLHSALLLDLPVTPPGAYCRPGGAACWALGL